MNTGGRVLLSLAAVLAATPLGLEKQSPDICEDGDYQDKTGELEIRGLMSFLRHPVFAKTGNTGGSASGIYLWKPREGEPHWRFGYGPDCWPQGKVFGVHRFHLGFDSRFKFAWEYDLPRVLCVGAYVHFDDTENIYAQQVSVFTAACLAYLSEPLPKKRLHWQETSASVKHMKRRPLFASTGAEHRMKYVETAPAIEAPVASNNFFDLAGERVLLMGTERGGIAEVWSHPIRLCRNFAVKIQSLSGEFLWDNAAAAKVVIRPHDIERRNDHVIEHIWLSADQPLACIDWQFEDRGEVNLELSFEIDFRLMWPYTEGCLSEIHYACSRNGDSIYLTDSRGLFLAQFALSCPGDAPVALDISSSLSSCARVTFRRRMKTRRSLHRRKTLQMVMVGGPADDAEVKRLRREFPQRLRHLYAAQVKAQNRLLENHAEIDTPEPAFNSAARWAKLKTAAFVCEAPKLGKSLLAGFARTGEGWLGGRPGYAWFFGRDACWTAFAMLHCGDFENVRSVLDFLGRHQEVTGKILHELSTSGAAYYDASDSTPLYVMLMARYLDHSGDLAFVRAQWPHIRKAMDYMFSTDRDGDGLIENTGVGHGWIEGGRLHGVHVEHYLAGCWAEALRGASHCANLLGEKSDAEKWAVHFERVKRILSKDFWNEKSGYFFHGKKRDGSFDDNMTLLAAVPMLFGYGKDEHALRALEVLAGKNFNADWGVRIVGDDHPFYSPQGYHDGSVWPLFTGWAALAGFKRGRPQVAMTQLKNSMRNNQHWALGCMEEVLHGELYQPAGVCPHQAWSESMIVQPIFEGLLGFSPNATQHEVEIVPRVPLAWPFFSAGPLRIGMQALYFGMERDGFELTFSFSLRGEKLRLFCAPHFPAAALVESLIVDGRQQSLLVHEKFDERVVPFAATIGGLTLRAVFRVSKFWSAIAPVADVKPGDQSKGFMIIRESLAHNGVTVEVEGDAGTQHRLEFVTWGYQIGEVRGGHLVALSGEYGAIEFRFGNGEKRYIRQIIEIDLK